MAKHAQETSSSQTAEAQIESIAGLDDLIQQGARRIIQQAIEAELVAMLEQYSNVKTIDGQRAVVRNGYLPEREIVAAVAVAAQRLDRRHGWAALAAVFPQTRHQRCWFHKIGNILNDMPRSQHGKAKAVLAAIWNVARRADASSRSISSSTRTRPSSQRPSRNSRRIETHCSRSTTSLSSTGSTCGPRTRLNRRSRRCAIVRAAHVTAYRATFLAIAFKLIEAAEKSWRKIRGVENIETLLKGVPFKDETLVGKIKYSRVPADPPIF